MPVMSTPELAERYLMQTGRRNITLSPKDGTPVVLESRAPAPERVLDTAA